MTKVKYYVKGFMTAFVICALIVETGIIILFEYGLKGFKDALKERPSYKTYRGRYHWKD